MKFLFAISKNYILVLFDFRILVYCSLTPSDRTGKKERTGSRDILNNRNQKFYHQTKVYVVVNS